MGSDVGSGSKPSLSLRLAMVWALAGGAFALGLSVLLGWAFSVPGLTVHAPAVIPMLPLTAAAITVASISLFCATASNTIARWAGNGAIAVVLATAAVCLAEALVGIDNPLRLLLFPAAPGGHRDWPLAMSETSSLCLALYAGAMFASEPGRQHSPRAFSLLATLGLLATVGSLLGYLFGAPRLLGVGGLQPIAAPSATGLLALFSGLLLLRADLAWPRLLLGDSLAARSARQMLPVVLLVPVLCALAALYGERAGWYGDELRLALTTLSSLVLLTFLLLASSHRSARLEAVERNALQALRDADRRKDEFLAMLGHELRNPLAPIRTASAVLKHQAGGDPRLGESCAIIDRQVRHMVRLVDDLLDVSRITSGRIALRREPVALATILDSAIESVREAAAAAGHVLEVKTDAAAALWVDGDATRLSQATLNLLGNAVRYTPPGGRIQLRCWHEQGWAHVSVQDNGIGFAPGELPRAFEMFTQIDSHGMRQGGLGVGLALARSLVELHGGLLTGNSAGRGMGSTFMVSLPLASAPVSVSAATVTGPARATPVPLDVLLVDDNRDALQTLAHAVALAGHRVRSATTGEEALALATVALPRVAVLDIGLPGMSGYVLAQRLRALAAGQPLQLFALTGWGQAHDRRAAADAGFDRHFTKPVDPDALLAAIAAAAPAATPDPA